MRAFADDVRIESALTATVDEWIADGEVLAEHDERFFFEVVIVDDRKRRERMVFSHDKVHRFGHERQDGDVFIADRERDDTDIERTFFNVTFDLFRADFDEF